MASCMNAWDSTYPKTTHPPAFLPWQFLSSLAPSSHWHMPLPSSFPSLPSLTSSTHCSCKSLPSSCAHLGEWACVASLLIPSHPQSPSGMFPPFTTASQLHPVLCVLGQMQLWTFPFLLHCLHVPILPSRGLFDRGIHPTYILQGHDFGWFCLDVMGFHWLFYNTVVV